MQLGKGEGGQLGVVIVHFNLYHTGCRKLTRLVVVVVGVDQVLPRFIPTSTAKYDGQHRVFHMIRRALDPSGEETSEGNETRR